MIFLNSNSDSDSGQFLALRQELINTYLVKAQNKAALTEYLKSRSCRQTVLAKHLNSYIKGTDCLITNSIYYNQCQELLKQQSSGSDSDLESRAKAIY